MKPNVIKLTTNALEEIYNIAIETRELISMEFGTDDLQGMCYYASTRLRRKLRFKGFRPKIIEGTFKIDTFYNYKRHYWLELNNFVIDITADQFNIELNKKYEHMSKVVLGTYQEYPRYSRR